MSRLYIHGCGVVSPAGWGLNPFLNALDAGMPLPVQKVARPGWTTDLTVRMVPDPAVRPAFLAHPRLRRSSRMTQHVVAAALEALGDESQAVMEGRLRLGVIVCMMAGGVSYSRRFYQEVLDQPGTASPLIFPETVFNASASHLSAYLQSELANATLVGDEGTFLQGVALAADWLEWGQADACLVIGTEEMDWIVADAVRLFNRRTVYAGGAGALLLKKDISSAICLRDITDSWSYLTGQNRETAALKMAGQWGDVAADEVIYAGESQTVLSTRYPNSRKAVKPILGEAFVASAAWQCVAACLALGRGDCASALVEILGTNQQAIGARFAARRCGEPGQ